MGQPYIAILDMIAAAAGDPNLIRGLIITVASGAAAFILYMIRALVKALPGIRRGFMFWNALVGENPDDVPTGQIPRLGLLDRMANLETVAIDNRDLTRRATSDVAAAKSAALGAQTAAETAGRAALGAQTAAETAARKADDAASLAREVSDLAGQAAHSADTAKSAAQAVSAQMLRNGGSSLRDVVESVAKRLDEHIATTNRPAA